MNDSEAKPVWVQIAVAGLWKGHQRFKAIEFDAGFFGKVVANFRAHPAFVAGTSGQGIARVVPFDYEHASEMPPTEGALAVTGAPACGWVLDLSVRVGAGGKAQLWALAEFLPKAREQIRAGGYRWTSVAIWPNAVDKVSGKEIGPVLTSVALTNKPFIEGMAPLTAGAQRRSEIMSQQQGPILFSAAINQIEADNATALGRLRAKFKDNDFRRLVTDAFNEAPDEVRSLFEDAATELKAAEPEKEPKKGAEKVAATAAVRDAIAASYGHTPLERAHNYLLATVKGFEKHDRWHQLQAASAFNRNLALGEPAARQAMTLALQGVVL